MRTPLAVSPPTMAGDEQIPFPALNAWVRAAAMCHYNITPLFDRVGLRLDLQGDHHIRRDGIIDLMLLCVGQAAPHSHFPLVLGESFGFDTMPAIETFLATSPTLRQALPALEWASHMLTDISIHLEEDRDQACIIIDVHSNPGDPPKARGYFAESIVAGFNKFARLMMGGRSPATRVDLAHDPGPVRVLCEMQWGVPVRVNQPRYALVFPRQLLDQQLPGALPDMHRQLHGVIQQRLPRQPSQTLTEKIEALFQREPEMLGQGLPNIADRLKMHPRTLQRRLKEEGSIYGDIQSRCRYRHAVSCLKSGAMDIDTLSETLGFSDRNSFTRAFKQWTGMVPREYRKLHCAELV